MPFYPSWVVYIDQAAKGEATQPMHPTEAKWAVKSIRELQAERDAALARVAALETELAKVKRYQLELAERCYRKDLELDAWRTGERPAPAADATGSAAPVPASAPATNSDRHTTPVSRPGGSVE